MIQAIVFTAGLQLPAKRFNVDGKTASGSQLPVHLLLGPDQVEIIGVRARAQIGIVPELPPHFSCKIGLKFGSRFVLLVSLGHWVDPFGGVKLIPRIVPLVQKKQQQNATILSRGNVVANKRVYKSKYGRDFPALTSQCDPLPYYPNLKRELRSFAAAVMVAYLETHWKAPQDQNDSISDGFERLVSLPVTLDLDQITRDLQIGRRTLTATLLQICSRFPSEEGRGRAARAGREFFMPTHTRYKSTKFYSITGHFTSPATRFAALRRNLPVLRKLLTFAAVSSPGAQFMPDWPLNPGSTATQNEATTQTLQSVSKVVGKERLSAIMLRGSVLQGDMRSNRHDRRRLTTKNGVPRSA